MSIVWEPKEYRRCGEHLETGRDLTEEQLFAMWNGSVFVLLGEDGVTEKTIVFMDSYNQIRECNIT